MEDPVQGFPMAFIHDLNDSIFCYRLQAERRSLRMVASVCVLANGARWVVQPNGRCKPRLRPHNPQSREPHRRSRQLDAGLGPCPRPARLTRPAARNGEPCWQLSVSLPTVAMQPRAQPTGQDGSPAAHCSRSAGRDTSPSATGGSSRNPAILQRTSRAAGQSPA